MEFKDFSYYTRLLLVVRGKQKVSNNRYIWWDMNNITLFYTLMEHISDQTEEQLQPVWTKVSVDCVVDAKKSRVHLSWFVIVEKSQPLSG